jgi:hypothetical protein
MPQLLYPQGNYSWYPVNRWLELIRMKNAELDSVLPVDCSSCLLVNETPWQKPTEFHVVYQNEICH